MNLALTDLLDARENPRIAIAGAVAIPTSQIPARRSELPPRNSKLRVIADDPGATTHALGALGITADFVAATTIGGGEGEGARLWSVDPLLEDATEPGEGRRAIDLGCGGGRGAVWLAANGWRVTAIDRLPDLVARAEALAQAHQLSLDARVERVENYLREGENYFDMAVMLYCWDTAWIDGLADLVRPGGRLVVATFALAHLKGPGGPADERCLTDRDLERLGRTFDVEHHADVPRHDRFATELVATRKG